VLLPSCRRLQLFYSRTFRAVEQVEADLLFGLCCCGLDAAARANGTLAARLPFRRFPFYAFVSRLWSALRLGALVCVCTSRLVNRMRFGHWVVLQLGNRAPCAALPPPKAPPLGRGASVVSAMLPGHQRQSACTLSSRGKSSSLCRAQASFCEPKGLKPILHQDGGPANSRLEVREFVGQLRSVHIGQRELATCRKPSFLLQGRLLNSNSIFSDWGFARYGPDELKVIEGLPIKRKKLWPSELFAVNGPRRMRKS
jgi:hypothetical protein